MHWAPWVVISLVLGLGGGARAQEAGNNASFQPLVTESQRAQWRKATEGLVVEVRRRAPLSPGFKTADGADFTTRIGRGLRLEAGRVMTASALTAGWPKGPRDVIEVVVGEQIYEAAVGVVDAPLGLAVLDVPGLPGTRLPGPLDSRFRFTGRWLFSRGLDGQPARVVVGGHGAGHRAYYFVADCAVNSIGTPVFDATGRWLSFVGLSPNAKGQCLLLPPKAVLEMWKRRDQWR